MEKNSDNFQMYCVECGMAHSVEPFDDNPTCTECGAPLDFELKHKEDKKCT